MGGRPVLGSPSSRRAWVEISVLTLPQSAQAVALLAEGVGKNTGILGIVGDQPGGLNLRKEPERMRIFVITYFVYGLIFIKHIKYIL